MPVDVYEPFAIVVVTPAANICIYLKFIKTQPNKIVLVVTFQIYTDYFMSVFKQRDGFLLPLISLSYFLHVSFHMVPMILEAQ